tara:strand:- start:56947 stop:57294 length:348 start_codon:yes stop_codon:yes gene_type:complete
MATQNPTSKNPLIDGFKGFLNLSQATGIAPLLAATYIQKYFNKRDALTPYLGYGLQVKYSTYSAAQQCYELVDIDVESGRRPVEYYNLYISAADAKIFKSRINTTFNDEFVRLWK